MAMIFERKKARRKIYPNPPKILTTNHFYKLSLPPNVTMFFKHFQFKAYLDHVAGEKFRHKKRVRERERDQQHSLDSR
jgi:hypothetical protein